MTKIEKLEQKLNEFIKIPKEEMIKILEECGFEVKDSNKENVGKWKPKEGEMYWFINDIGRDDWCHCENDEVDNWRIKNMPLFKSEEECEKYHKFRDAVKEKSYEFSEEEWKDDIYKYLIMYDFCDECFVVDTTAFLKSLGEIYFKTEADAQYIIDNYKEELLKYWL